MTLRAVCILTLLFLLGPTGAWSKERPEITGPLADYLKKDDPSYQWKKRHDGTIGSVQYAELILTSQTWHGIPWKHQLYVLRPSTSDAQTKHALLFIAGGSWRAELDNDQAEVKLPREAQILAQVAETLKTPIAVLLHVPQQPIFDGKKEDAIIAYTFEEFLKTREPDWPLLLPMVKSAVRAMDAIQAFAAQEWSQQIQEFTVTGASKRGWTTWLTGAMDRRATHIAPMVIDMLNMGPQMKLQRDSFGTPSAEIADYTARGLDKHLETEGGKRLREIVDPYAYRAALTQPKLIILGTNDRYWPLDAANLYWDGLDGQKHLLYVPNNGHGLSDLTRLIGGLSALHHQAVTGKMLPKLTWKFGNGNGKISLRLESDVVPKQVNLWTAAAQTRDFRDSKWSARAVYAAEGKYISELTIPGDGFMAMFAEAEYAEHTFPLYLSTNVRIAAAADATGTGGQ